MILPFIQTKTIIYYLNAAAVFDSAIIVFLSIRLLYLKAPTLPCQVFLFRILHVLVVVVQLYVKIEIMLVVFVMVLNFAFLFV